MDFDTIAAISTPLGEGGIAVIRVSGQDAISIVDQLFKGKDLGAVDSHTVHYGHFLDINKTMIEEVLVTVMRSPRTFTREDVVEVHCHGGIISVKRVLQNILAAGARLAEPGEFTKRAFLNGRIDLSQAEGVIDIIRSKTDKAMNVAFQQVQGRLSKKIQLLRQELIEVLAHIEVTIDYPEHDVADMTHQLLLNKCASVQNAVQQLLMTAEQGKILREGLKTAIIGRPNVGKSSLLNALVHENKAIVTHIPGTTRDVVEEYVNIRGVPLQLVDTAGIRETADIVEKVGIEKSRQVLKEANLILLVLNVAEGLTEEDLTLLKLIEDKNKIIILNKTDLKPVIDKNDIQQHVYDAKFVHTSMLNDKGLDELEQAIADIYFSGTVESQDLTYVSNVRHISLLQQTHQSLADAILGINSEVPIDVLQIDIQKAWELLGEINGDTVSESLIDQLFSQFCLGK